MTGARITQTQIELLRMRGDGAAIRDMAAWMKIGEGHVRQLLREADRSLNRPNAIAQHPAPARRFRASQSSGEAMDLDSL